MYCLTCTIAGDQHEIADAIGYGYDAGGCVEEAAAAGRIKLIFYFADKDNADNAASSLKEMLSVDDAAIEFVDDKQDWNAKWRESMEPAQIAEGVWVSPTWLEPPPEGRKAWIKIEPKMAFGTGHHETTRLAAKMLISRKNEVAGKNVLDIGTGSGILCFVADYAGAGSALGVEIDEDCRENLAENLRDNPPRRDGAIEFLIGTLDAVNADAGAGTNTDKIFDVVIMNMLSTESSPLLGQIRAMTKKGALLIWSGILAGEKDEVINTAGKFGFRIDNQQTENEWWCGAFLRD
ncbi:MAG: 50S ribosomal protein L11 methyltransferase [Chitinispirillia bacterium]|nr:50S ribosomal protein L11 methyltransferase [Chitinispirillia bacterium]MCL2267869.1 50S ribosomal protein L11 methyltransferase [Chitinispirillia bacterium]